MSTLTQHAASVWFYSTTIICFAAGLLSVHGWGGLAGIRRESDFTWKLFPAFVGIVFGVFTPLYGAFATTLGIHFPAGSAEATMAGYVPGIITFAVTYVTIVAIFGRQKA